ncbi:MAG: FAD-dependent oxidoreductase [Bacteroidales bacterium]|nr:FAD-dependent oxidoreductase [Bacteroidales bacterium]
MLNLRNPFIMAPIKLGYSFGDGKITHKHVDFYQERSGYIGAITLEPLYMDAGLREIPTQLGIDSDDKIEGLQRLVDHIHEDGAAVIAHLNHPGRMANPKIPGNYHISSSDQPCENGGAIPRRMEKQDFFKVIGLFTQAAIRAEKTGFDIIELQFGHGYLLAQFLSPKVNDRTDEYGGSLENRMRFPLEVLEVVKSAVSLPVIVRISGDDMIPDGIHLSEMIEFSKRLKEKGVEAIHVSAGTVCSTPPWFFQHMFVPKGKTWEFAKTIQEKVDIPTIFVGRINSAEDIEMLKKNFGAHYFAIGRALVADPLFVGKYLREVEGQIRPCLACAEGCLGGVRAGKGLHCVVNPMAGESYPELIKAPVKKKYAVVGGGLAGMEAALTLNERGHEVVMYEKNELGGQFNLAYLPPKKENLKKIIDFYKNQLEVENISVIYEEATLKKLLAANYDGVVLATGAVPAIPPIKGLKKYFWTEFLHEEHLPENKNVLIIGGGLIGIEVASKLVEQNNKVVIVEMMEEIARGMEMIEKTLTLKKLKEKGVEIYTSTKVVEIDGKSVKLEGAEETTLEDVDHIVLTTGMKSYNPLFDKIRDKIKTYVIGDAKEVGKAYDAIRDGYNLGLTL